MPQAIEALVYVGTLIENIVVAGAEALGASEAAAVALGNAAVALASAAALGAVAGALAPKTPTPEAMRLTFRQAIPPRRRGCGHTRLGGPYLLDYAADGVLHRVIAVADCPCGNIDQYWLHQDTVRVIAGVVQSLPNGAYDAADERVKVATTFGATATPAFAALHAEVGAQWGTTASCTGIFAAYLRCQSPKLQYFAHDYPHGQDPQLNVAVDVNVFYDWRNPDHDILDWGTWSASKNPVIVLVNELWRYHDYEWAADFAPAIAILTAEADVCDEAVPILIVLAKITQDIAAGDGVVHLAHVDGLVIGTTIFIAGQTFTTTSAPADDGLGGWLVDLSAAFVAGLATGAVASWNSDPGAPVTRPRYTVGGAWNADEAESDTVKRLLDAMDGFMMRRGSDNAVIIRAGHWIEPTIILGADELIDYTWQPFVETGRAVNELVPAFSSPAHDYATIDSTPWRDEDDITTRGLVSSQPFAPELVQENNQLMRLAKAAMTRRAVPVETFKFKASALRVIEDAARWIRLQAGLDELSDLEDVVLEIAGDFQIDDNGMSVVLPVRKADSGLYTFDYETEEGAGPADASRPYHPPLPRPAIASITPFNDTIGSGAQGVRLAIDVTGPARQDLNWSWRWRVTGDTAWRDTTTNQTAGGTVTLNTDFIPTDTDLDVAVAYMTGIGTLSPWSATSTITIDGTTLNLAAAGLGTIATQDADAVALTGGTVYIGPFGLNLADPSQPTIPLKASPKIYKTWDTTDFSSLPNLTYGGSAGSPTEEWLVGDPALQFINGDVSLTTPIERRVRTGVVNFKAECWGTVDNFISIWYAVNGGAPVFLDYSVAPAAGSDYARAVWSGDITVAASDVVAFYASVGDNNGIIYSHTHRDFVLAGLSVEASNF